MFSRFPPELLLEGLILTRGSVCLRQISGERPVDEIEIKAAHGAHVIGAIAGLELVHFFRGELRVNEAGFLHAVTWQCAGKKKSLTPKGTSSGVFLVGFCAMVSLQWRSRYRLFRPTKTIYQVLKFFETIER